MTQKTSALLLLLGAALAASGAAALAQGAPQGSPAEKALPAPPDVAAPPKDAQVYASGLASKVLEPGTGTEHPTASSHVIVHYTAWKAADGEMFDSSVVRAKRASLDLNVMIDGFREGLQLMVTGEKRRLWIPPELAYDGVDGKPQGMLVFDVELFDFVSTPRDVAAPPEDAEGSKSGLAWKVLRAGSGSVHPRKSSRVTVHYSGWTTDGEMFDSSVTRGRPTTFQLGQVIRGWTEGLQLMVEGEKRRFWIPDKLAYKGVPGRPQGTLVFDVELISIQ